MENIKNTVMFSNTIKNTFHHDLQNKNTILMALVLHVTSRNWMLQCQWKIQLHKVLKKTCKNFSRGFLPPCASCPPNPGWSSEELHSYSGSCKKTNGEVNAIKNANCTIWRVKSVLLFVNQNKQRRSAHKFRGIKNLQHQCADRKSQMGFAGYLKFLLRLKDHCGYKSAELKHHKKGWWYV